MEKKNQNGEEKKKKITRQDLIESVRTPFGFFALVVLVSETIQLALISKAQGTDVTILIIAMSVLLLMVVAIVGIWTLRHYRTPDNVDASGPRVVKIESTQEDSALLQTEEMDRRIGLFSEDVYQSYPVTLRQLIRRYDAEQDNDGRQFRILIRLIDLLERNRDLKNIEVELIADNRHALAKLDLIWHPCLPERDRYISTGYPKPTYEGPFPTKLIPRDLVSSWSAMAEYAKKLLLDGYLSPYRIVLSYATKDYMTITCTKYSKAEIIPFAHTPVVKRIHPKPTGYFGHIDHGPSSEMVPHLAIHRYLEDENGTLPSACIHCHSLEVLEWLGMKVDHQMILPKDGILDYIKFGTAELGEELAKVLLTKRSAMVRDHGIWTTGASVEAAYLNFLQVIAEVRQLLGSAHSPQR